LSGSLSGNHLPIITRQISKLWNARMYEYLSKREPRILDPGSYKFVRYRLDRLKRYLTSFRIVH
jgi:hypothetical protein